MKRILHTVLMLTMAVAMFAQSYPRKVTEEDIPSSERNKYFEQVENNIHNFYMLLLDLSDREMREEFISEIFMDNSNRHIPEFYLLDKKDQRLSPGQYLIELDKVISSFDRDGLDFQIENISHQPDMFMMNMRSCYVHSEYDLTLKDNGKVVFKRRCRITSFFPKASSYIRVKTMQVEPVRDIIAYKKPVTQTVVADNNQTTKKVKVSDVTTKKFRLDDIFESNREGEYFEQIKAKAEQGDLHAQCKLGDLYRSGWPLSDKQYHRLAFEWYNKAAGQGSIEAVLKLGECYDKGIGVNKDYKIAFEYYEKASKYYESAQIETAICYYQGKGVTQSYQKAFKCFDKVIHKKYDRKNPDHRKAAYFIGLMYEYGQGMDVNLYKALIYYEKSGLYKDAPDRIRYITINTDKHVREPFFKKNSNKDNNIAISGTVVSRDNNQNVYHSGAIASNINTGEFVSTDKNGTFQGLKIKEGDILCIYYNGYTIEYLECKKEWDNKKYNYSIVKAYEHTVKEHETIERICLGYDISIHQLINHNAILTIDKKIKVGQKLYIPVERYYTE